MKKIIYFLCLFLPLQLMAAEDLYPFNSVTEQQQFTHLLGELRCLVCQNQNLAESNAALAIDLRDEIYQKVRNGEPSQQIINFLTARYGDFILYRPPLNRLTLGLWLGPVILFMVSFGYLIFYIRHKNKGL